MASAALYSSESEIASQSKAHRMLREVSDASTLSDEEVEVEPNEGKLSKQGSEDSQDSQMSDSPGSQNGKHPPLIKMFSTSLTSDQGSSHGDVKDAQRPPPPSRRKGVVARVLYTISEILWLLRMGVVCLGYLGFAGKWIVMAGRLGFFAMFLLPAWFILGYTYFTSPHIKRGVRYGKFNRNFCDLYIPPNASSKSPTCPVVVFVSGGAWTIGYKAWGALLGIGLQRHGVILVCADYRNFPQGRIGDMVDDASNALSWTTAHIREWGGDANNIYFVGQSAGAHIVSLVTMLKVKKEGEELMKEIQGHGATRYRHQIRSIAEDPQSSSSHTQSNGNGVKYRRRASTTAEDRHHDHDHNSSTNGDIDEYTTTDTSALYDKFGNDDTTTPRRVSTAVFRTGDRSHEDDYEDVIEPDQDLIKASTEVYEDMDRSSVNRGRPSTSASASTSPRSIGSASRSKRARHPRNVKHLTSMDCECCTPSFNRRAATTPSQGRSTSALTSPVKPLLSSPTSGGSSAHQTPTVRRTRVVLKQKWRLSQIRCVIGVSGVYNLIDSLAHMEIQGLPARMLYAIMSSKAPSEHDITCESDANTLHLHASQPLMTWSPSILAHTSWFKRLAHLTPPVLLIHGTADSTALWHLSEQYGRALASSGVHVAVKYYEGNTHTDPIIEGPMAGHDHLMYDVLAVIHRMSHHADRRRQRRETRARSIVEGDYDSAASDDDSSDNDLDKIAHPPKIAGYIRTRTYTSDRLDPMPDFNLANENQLKALYNLPDPKPMIPKILINAARHVNPF